MAMAGGLRLHLRSRQVTSRWPNLTKIAEHANNRSKNYCLAFQPKIPQVE